jgi:predicted ArsR family transcriptional regulator
MKGVATKLAILHIVRDEGPVTAKSVADAVAVSRERVRRVMQDLDSLLLVERVNGKPRFKTETQTYRLSAAGAEALGDEEALRSLLLTPPKASVA